MSIGTRQSFGMRVRSLRKQQGLSLRKFALMINIDKNYLVDVEYGRSAPSLDTIDKIARGLDLTLSQLFDEVELRNEPLHETHRKPSRSYHTTRLPQ